jgi:hypothetical protein
MDDTEYKRKYANLRVLKGIQEYLKKEGADAGTVYPVRVPDELVYQMLQLRGADHVDRLVHEIFRLGLVRWSERLYEDEFGSEEDLESFIELMKKRNT